MDRALSQDMGGTTEDIHMQPRLSASMSHDVWRKRALVKSSTGTQIQLLGEDTERVPTSVPLPSSIHIHILELHITISVGCKLTLSNIAICKFEPLLQKKKKIHIHVSELMYVVASA